MSTPSYVPFRKWDDHLPSNIKGERKLDLFDWGEGVFGALSAAMIQPGTAIARRYHSA